MTDRRTRTRQELRRERREALGYLALTVVTVALGIDFWFSLLQALEVAAL